MLTRSLSIATLSLVLSGPVWAQQSSNPNDGYDFDTLAACSIVYQRIGELYAEKGDTQQGQSFQNTAYAFSSAAYYTLSFETDDQSLAHPYSVDRMKIIMESLNDSSLTNPDGDMGVINEWLPYCDTLGIGVKELLAQRENAGW
jgi:hypothetical protein